MPMTELPAEARERIAREFAPGDRDAAEWRVAAYQAQPFAPGGIWADLLELARGSLRWLDDALALGRADWRDLMVAAECGGWSASSSRRTGMGRWKRRCWGPAKSSASGATSSAPARSPRNISPRSSWAR